MTDNYHAPIPSSPPQPANAATINAPLGELDAAITNQASQITALDGRVDTLEADMPVPSGNPTEFLDGDGNWTVPSGTGASVDGHVIQDEGVDLPQRAKVNFVGAGVTVTNEAGGTRVSIPGTTGVQSVVAGSNVSVDNTDPENPVVSASAVQSVVAGSNVSVDNTNPENPVISASAVQSVVAGSNVSVDNTNPENPVISASAVQSVVAGTGLSVDNTDPENPVVSATGGSGAVLNELINPSFSLWTGNTDPTTPAAMSDDAYTNMPDCWNALLQGAGATVARGGRIGLSRYSLKLTAGGTTNRYGAQQILDAQKSIAKRGKTTTVQFKLKPTNNAGSGTRDYRIALLEWTGTPDSVTSDIVNNWASSTYTTGNFFNSTSLTLIGTEVVTATHNAESQLSVSGVVSASCNNLIVFIWVEDVPTHASDYVEIGEPGYFESASVQTWIAPDPAVEKLEAAWFINLLTHSGVGKAETTTLADVITQFPFMRSAPTASIQGTITLAVSLPVMYQNVTMIIYTVSIVLQAVL